MGHNPRMQHLYNHRADRERRNSCVSERTAATLLIKNNTTQSFNEKLCLIFLSSVAFCCPGSFGAEFVISNRNDVKNKMVREDGYSRTSLGSAREETSSRADRAELSPNWNCFFPFLRHQHGRSHSV